MKSYVVATVTASLVAWLGAFSAAFGFGNGAVMSVIIANVCVIALNLILAIVNLSKI